MNVRWSNEEFRETWSCGEDAGGDIGQRSRPGRDDGVEREIGGRMLGRTVLRSVLGLGLRHDARNRTIWRNIGLQEERWSQLHSAQGCSGSYGSSGAHDKSLAS
jgi:hypothetical protein